MIEIKTGYGWEIPKAQVTASVF